MHDGKKATDGIELPPEELDELDAAEAAQFKADVQGHRHHEVHFALLVPPDHLFLFDSIRVGSLYCCVHGKLIIFR